VEGTGDQEIKRERKPGSIMKKKDLMGTKQADAQIEFVSAESLAYGIYENKGEMWSRVGLG